MLHHLFTHKSIFLLTSAVVECHIYHSQNWVLINFIIIQHIVLLFYLCSSNSQICFCMVYWDLDKTSCENHASDNPVCCGFPQFSHMRTLSVSIFLCMPAQTLLSGFKNTMQASSWYILTATLLGIPCEHWLGLLFAFRAALFLCGTDLTRWWKHSWEILVLIDMRASCSYFKFISYTLIMQISCSTTSQSFSAESEAIWVDGSHCDVQEIGLKWFELCYLTC